MKKQLFFAILIAIKFTVTAQIPQSNLGYKWAYQTLNSSFKEIRIDSKGYLCTIGSLYGAQNFDFFNAGIPGISSFTSIGNNDIIACKYDVNLNLIWAKQVGGTSNDVALNFCLDTLDNFIVNGYFFSSVVDFDPGAGTSNLYFNNFQGLSGPCASFILKLSPSGNFIWADGFQGSAIHSVIFNAVTTDTNNNVYCTAGFQDTVDFNPSAAVYSLATIGLKDAFILKLNSGGNFVDVKRFGAPNAICNGNGIKAGKLGGLYWSGNLKGNSVDLDPSSGVFSITPNPNAMFVSKLSTSFGFQWADAYQNNTQIGLGIYFDLDANENIYAKGNFTNTVDFDPSNVSYNLTSSSTGSDIFITKLNNTGSFVWAKQIGGAITNAQANYISLDNLGNVFTTGQFASPNSTINFPCDFDPGPNIYQFASKGNFDIYICKLDNNGNFVWAKQMGGITQDIGYALAIDNNYNVYTVGVFGAVTDFDPGIGVQNLSSTNGGQGFIQKLSPCVGALPPSLIPYEACAGQSATITAISSGTTTWSNAPIVNSVSATGANFITPTLSAGAYTFYAAANNTCAASSLTAIVINAASQQTVNVSATTQSLCKGETTTLTASGASNYTWAIGSNTVAQTIVIQPSVTSNVTLTATGSSTLCPAIQIIPITVNKCLGEEELKIKNLELKIYPNPANNQLFFDAGIQENGSIEIFDLMGKQILKTENYSSLSGIDIKEFSKGIYLYQIKTNNNFYSGKFLKQ